MRYGLLLLLLGLPLLAFADIYQWTDNSGIVHFTDMPLPGAKSVNLADDSMAADNPPPADVEQATTMDMSNADAAEKQPDKSKAAKATSTESAAETETAPAKKSNNKATSDGYYTHLVIAQPQNDASYFNNRGEVDVMMDVKPKLRETDKAVVLIDGKAFPTTRNDTLLRVENVERGTHTAQIQIQDKSGQALIESKAITFYMHKASVNSPANPPAQKLNPPLSPLNPPAASLRPPS